MNPSTLYTVRGLIEQVCENVGSTDSVTQAQARRWLNRALIRFMELGQWPWQKFYGEDVSTIANEATVIIPNTLEITALFMRSPYQKKLDLIEDREFRAKFPNDTFTGCPYFYRMNGVNTANPNSLVIGLYPIPDAVYDLKFDGIRPIVLPNSDSQDIRSVTGMPSTLVDVLIDMATAIGFRSDDDKKAQELLAESLARLERAFGMNDSKIDDHLVMAPFGGSDPVLTGDPLFPPNMS